jgi:hypothetical protein
MMRESHDRGRQSSARLAVKARVSCGSLRRVCLCVARRQVGLHEVVRFSRGAKTYCQTGEVRGWRQDTESAG